MNVEPVFSRKRTRSDGWAQEVMVGLAMLEIVVHEHAPEPGSSTRAYVYITCSGNLLHSNNYPSRRDADSAAERLLPKLVERTRRCVSELLEPVE